MRNKRATATQGRARAGANTALQNGDNPPAADTARRRTWFETDAAALLNNVEVAREPLRTNAATAATRLNREATWNWNMQRVGGNQNDAGYHR